VTVPYIAARDTSAVNPVTSGKQNATLPSEWLLHAEDRGAVNWVDQAGNIMFHFNLRPKRNQGDGSDLVMNDCQAGRWGREERQRIWDTTIKAHICVTPAGYEVSINGEKRCIFRHRCSWSGFQSIRMQEGTSWTVKEISTAISKDTHSQKVGKPKVGQNTATDDGCDTEAVVESDSLALQIMRGEGGQEERSEWVQKKPYEVISSVSSKLNESGTEQSSDSIKAADDRYASQTSLPATTEFVKGDVIAFKTLTLCEITWAPIMSAYTDGNVIKCDENSITVEMKDAGKSHEKTIERSSLQALVCLRGPTKARMNREQQTLRNIEHELNPGGQSIVDVLRQKREELSS